MIAPNTFQFRSRATYVYRNGLFTNQFLVYHWGIGNEIISQFSIKYGREIVADISGYAAEKARQPEEKMPYTNPKKENKEQKKEKTNKRRCTQTRGEK